MLHRPTLALLAGFSLLTLSLVAGSGCARPPLGPPGTLQYQRYEATMHDPYPVDDLGPEVVGGRPRDFQEPLPEPVRNRWLTDSWWRR